jgi:hypothetical protein
MSEHLIEECDNKERDATKVERMQRGIDENRWVWWRGGWRRGCGGVGAGAAVRVWRCGGGGLGWQTWCGVGVAWVCEPACCTVMLHCDAALCCMHCMACHGMVLRADIDADHSSLCLWLAVRPPAAAAPRHNHDYHDATTTRTTQHSPPNAQHTTSPTSPKFAGALCATRRWAAAKLAGRTTSSTSARVACAIRARAAES